MLFQKLKIGLKNYENQREFYQEILGFHVSTQIASELSVQAGTTSLVFSKQIRAPNLYHFCFLIPTGSLESAINFLDSRDIVILPFHGEKIVHFYTGRSVYFFDPDGNIAEFIERPLLNYPQKNSFNINDIICVNEIGNPVSNPLETSHILMTKHGVRPINPETWTDKFCWAGDHEGAIIVVKEGRHWMPTEMPGVLNDFEIEYQDQKRLRQVRFAQGKIESSRSKLI